MLAPPTPIGNKFDIIINTKGVSNKNNSYEITMSSDSCTSIFLQAVQINDDLHKIFSNNFTLEKIKENKYFYQFDDLKDICEELSERIKVNKISLIENLNNLTLSIPLPSTKIKEAIFILNEKIKSDKERINDLSKIVIEQRKEINELKNEIINLKEISNQQVQVINELKEKIDILWNDKKENSIIQNLNSKIINHNNDYENRLKNWINPNKSIIAQLLYRLTENGENISKFHELCDNKGATLTLFHIKDRNIVGIYTPLSWDTTSQWKNDMETFVFNLNKNIKCEKMIKEKSIYCGENIGPYVYGLGCYNVNSMKSIYFDRRTNYSPPFLFHSEFMNSNDGKKIYELSEVEIFKIR